MMDENTSKNKINLELNDIISEISSFVISNIHKPVTDTFNECILAIKEDKLDCDTQIKIESVTDFLHDEIHTGNWKDVPITIRQAHTIAATIQAVIFLKLAPEINVNILKDAIAIIDTGILIGAPFEENFDVITAFASKLSQTIARLQTHDYWENLKPKETVGDLNKHNTNKRKFDTLTYDNLKAKEIETESKPSVELFKELYFSTKIPVRMQDVMSEWPACKKWMDVRYLLKVAGNRIVPIEIGSQYTAENFSQSLMSLEDFIKNFYLSETDNIGYLAQHNLFEQIPELFEDIAYPPYCFVSRDLNQATTLSDIDSKSKEENKAKITEDTCNSVSKLISEPDVNVWFGPKGTISSLHQDPRDNILAQVFGKKQVVLFSPRDTKYLHPHDTKMFSNTSQVDPVNPNLENFPDFEKATMYKCLLDAGDMLYIPQQWWHHVISLDKSFSVNFWWD